MHFSSPFVSFFCFLWTTLLFLNSSECKKHIYFYASFFSKCGRRQKEVDIHGCTLRSVFRSSYSCISHFYYFHSSSTKNSMKLQDITPPGEKIYIWALLRETLENTLLEWYNVLLLSSFFRTQFTQYKKRISSFFAYLPSEINYANPGAQNEESRIFIGEERNCNRDVMESFLSSFVSPITSSFS